MSNKKSAPALEEKNKLILGLLPGGDCGGFGGCGCATCQECAEKIAEEGLVALCPACNQETVDKIAEALGLPTVATKDQIAFVACDGHAAGKERFASCESCKEAKQLGFKRGECKSGCVGVGSCVEACKFDAMSLVEGKIVIDTEKCNGCGACANAQVCPQSLITMIPRDATNFIPCSSTEEDDQLVREICGHGCIACGECERACPEGAVHVIDNHAVIDYDKCVGCVACAVKCKKKIIVDTLHDITALKANVAFVQCSSGKKSEAMKDAGCTTCKEAAKLDANAMGLCSTGCLGHGDCSKACRYFAITLVEGVAYVDTDKCVGCKDCTFACPMNLITIIPYKGMKKVPCASKATYEERAAVCDSGCIACHDCLVNCPQGAIYADENHTVIDPELCEDCNVCQYMCPRFVIKETEVPEHIFLQREALGIKEGE